jgi:NhaC family Na+:H+ antiporter
MLGVMAESLLKLVKGTGSLVLVTVLSCVFINIVSADQYLAIVIPGRMFKSAYAERHLAPKNLSRTLEDAGTLTSPLIPWNTCGAFMQTALGVPVSQYLPWALLNLINPLVSIALAYLGLWQTPMTEEEIAAYEASKAAIAA